MAEAAGWRDVLWMLLALAPAEQRFVVDRVRGAVILARVWPGPPVAPAVVFARIRYARTGRRQWIIAPGLDC